MNRSTSTHRETTDQRARMQVFTCASIKTGHSIRRGAHAKRRDSSEVANICNQSLGLGLIWRSMWCMVSVSKYGLWNVSVQDCDAALAWGVGDKRFDQHKRQTRLSGEYPQQRSLCHAWAKACNSSATTCIPMRRLVLLDLCGAVRLTIPTTTATWRRGMPTFAVLQCNLGPVLYC